jgi:7-carboxy-7-deazaguanine synthase
MDLGAIAARVSAFGLPLAEITGGEPLLQEETPELAARLLGLGMEVLVETNGSQDIGRLPPDAKAVMDVKCPGSGEAESLDRENLHRLRPGDELKCVLADRRDYDYARAMLETTGGCRVRPVHFQPVSGLLDPRDLAAWMLEDNVDARLSLQLHKILWGDRRGV